jgi:hypothetical protein
MRKQTGTLKLTLAQALIAQGLIKNPVFIQAATVQAAMLNTGDTSYRLLGSIIHDIETENPSKVNPIFEEAGFDAEIIRQYNRQNCS